MSKKINLKIKGRQKKLKTTIIESLKKYPVIQAVCERVGISRATYYRWIQQSSNFKILAEKATTEGSQIINDMAEAKLFKQIQAENMTAIIFWLKYRNKNYRVNIDSQTRIVHEPTPEQRKKATKAIRAILEEKSHCADCGKKVED